MPSELSGRAASYSGGAALARQLRQTAAPLIALVHGLNADVWGHVPGPGVWSIGKEAEHVVDGVEYHRWIVRRTIGERGSSRRPALERVQLTTANSPDEVAALLHEQVEASARLVESLSDEQLALPNRPPRANMHTLAEAIERILIRHIDAHRREIESKLGVSH